MLKFLPVGFIGLMVGGLIAANSSTILTHLNWGASYLVHDFYRRFLNKDGDGEALRHGRAPGHDPPVLLRPAGLVFLLDTAKDSFDIILQVGAGTGLLYLVRWFWWRVNAWCEVNAMVSSFVFSVLLLVLRKFGLVVPTHYALILTVAGDDGRLDADGLLRPEDRPRRRSSSSTRRSGRSGPGWEPVRKAGRHLQGGGEGDRATTSPWPWSAGSRGRRRSGRRSSPSATSSTSAGPTRPSCSRVFIVSGTVLLRVINRLWAKTSVVPGAGAAAS